MIVYIQGSFDLFHRGHARLLARARRIADMTDDPRLIVGVISDEAYQRNRGYASTQSEEVRADWISDLGIADEVHLVDNLNTKDDLEIFEVDIVIVGSDWAKKELYRQYDLTQEWLDGYGIELLYVPYTEGISSTQIKKEMNEETRT